MGYPASVDSGGVPPLIISNEVAGLTGSSNAASANTVYVYAFELQVGIMIAKMQFRNTATTTGATNMGFFTFADGKIVAGSDTGPVTDVANTLQVFTYASLLMLGPGQYFLALACNAADTFQSVAPTITNNSRSKRATNVLAAGALPLTLGAIVSNVAFAPGMAALISGGLT